jgi:hypothetical protein
LKYLQHWVGQFCRIHSFAVSNTPTEKCYFGKRKWTEFNGNHFAQAAIADAKSIQKC